MRRGMGTAAAIAVAVLLPGCGLAADGRASTTTTASAPLSTTTTTAPPTTSSTTTSGALPPAPPQADDLVRMTKDQMLTAGNVTIDGLVQGKDGPYELRAEGSAGGAGLSRSVLTMGGGSLEIRVIGNTRYVRADRAYLEAAPTTVDKDSVLRAHPDTWLELPWVQESSLDVYRPREILRGSFFGEALTEWDARRSAVRTVPKGDGWIYEVELARAKGGNELARVLWISTDPRSPQLLRVVYGDDPRARSRMSFSRWGSTPEQVAAPQGAVKLEEGDPNDLVSP